MSRVFLVNPASANGSTGRRWPEVARRAASLGLEGETLWSERPGHLAELAAEAVANGATAIVVVGGDGTVHEVVDGLAGADGSERVELGVIPFGTGRDFARSLRIPRRLDDALDVVRDGGDRRRDAAGGGGGRPGPGPGAARRAARPTGPTGSRPRGRALIWGPWPRTATITRSGPPHRGTGTPVGYGVIGSTTDSGSVSLGSSPSRPARIPVESGDLVRNRARG